ncbi:MAG: sigma-70 family RNA polymerase sigma factor [Bacteroidales bacterium]|nr:sigma-70 family RNA polymerase sigma factor [Bacteroidales bacterium]
MDERSLVRRCSAGDPGARQEMYETYAGRVLAVCRRYVRDADRARDLTHDTFLKAWDSLDRFRPRRAGSLGAWLCRIAAHLSVDELRKGKRLVEIPDQARDDGDRDPEEMPVDQDRLRQVPVEELIDLIASLPEGYRAVFNLFCLDGCSHREIAQMLGITEKTSQTQYLKARRKLAALIAAKYGADE